MITLQLTSSSARFDRLLHYIQILHWSNPFLLIPSVRWSIPLPWVFSSWQVRAIKYFICCNEWFWKLWINLAAGFETVRGYAYFTGIKNEQKYQFVSVCKTIPPTCTCIAQNNFVPRLWLYCSLCDNLTYPACKTPFSIKLFTYYIVKC